MTRHSADCELCSPRGGTCCGATRAAAWCGGRCRLSAFCRVIWNAHVREMTDLSAPDRAHLMDVVFAVETVLRRTRLPLRSNLASLGNLTPHLHWHVIPALPRSAFPRAGVGRQSGMPCRRRRRGRGTAPPWRTNWARVRREPALQAAAHLRRTPAGVHLRPRLQELAGRPVRVAEAAARPGGPAGPAQPLNRFGLPARNA